MGVGQTRGGGDKADAPPHGLQHQHGIGRARAEVLLVGTLHHERPVARRAAIPRRVVNELERGIAHVVIDGLGDADGHEVEPPRGRQRGHLVGRVHRVVAAIVEKVAYVVGAEHIDDPLIVLALVVTQLVATGSNDAGSRRRAEKGDLFIGLRGEVEELLTQHPLDAVIAGIDGPKGVGHRAADVDHPTKGAVDHQRRSTGLGHNDVSIPHGRLLACAVLPRCDPASCP